MKILTILLLALLLSPLTGRSAIRREYNATVMSSSTLDPTSVGLVPNVCEYTIGGWFLRRLSAEAGATLLRKANTSGGLSEWWIFTGDATSCDIGFQQAFTTSSRVYVKTGANAFATNQWFMLAVTWSTNNVWAGTNTNAVHIYVNGSEITTRAILQNANPVQPTGDAVRTVRIGEFGTSSPDSWVGEIGEVFYFTNVLSQIDIYNLYRMSKNVAGIPRMMTKTSQGLPYYTQGLNRSFGSTNSQVTGTQNSLWCGNETVGIATFIYGSGSRISYP